MKATLTMLCIALICFFSSSAMATKKLDHFECKHKDITYDDGDTFGCKGIQVRILGIDTPEIRHEEHGISVDQPMGRDAAQFTKGILENAKRITVITAGKDKYERTLAHVLVDGELLGVKLIKAGLAYETVSFYGDNGMPEFALQIAEAAKVSPKPKFQNPHNWRKKNQKKSY